MNSLSVFLLFLSLLNVSFVNSLSEDVVQLREHFIANLLEEHRENFQQKLTEEVQQKINERIETFMRLIEEPPVRRRREVNQPTLNEKPTEVEVLTGFEDRGNVPINFPHDICMFRINEKSVAIGVSQLNDRERILMIFKRENKAFHKVEEFSSKYLSKIDCRAVGNVGYVAVVNSRSSADDSPEIPSSFIYKITMNEQFELDIEKMQPISEQNQINVRLWSRNEDLFLIYTYNDSSIDNCKLYKLKNDSFKVFDQLPCHNARVVEFFHIEQELFIFVGNYREINGTTNTFSTIMRFDETKKKFVMHQKLYTNAIRVGKYFHIDYQRQRQHFLFIGNSYEINEFGAINYEVPSMMYKFVNGYFVPLQTIKVKHVVDVAPIVKKEDFHLLISSDDTEVQIYYFDGWKFQEASIAFTGEAFGAGVTSMRVYNDIIENTTTLVISNRNINGNQHNVYTPTYNVKQDSTGIKTNILKWCNFALKRVNDFNAERGDEMVKSVTNLTSEESDEVHFMSQVNLTSTKIDQIIANEFIYRGRVLNKEKIDRINKLKTRSDQIERDLAKLRQKINFVKATRRNRRQITNDQIINNFTVTQSLILKTINGKPLENLVFANNLKNSRLKSITAREFTVKEELFVDGKVDGIAMNPNNLIMNIPNQILNPMKVEKLNVNNLAVRNVNGMPFESFNELLQRKVNVKMPNNIHELDVESLRIDNLINGGNFIQIVENSLKSSGDQMIFAPMKVESLKVKEVNFDRTAEKISEIPLKNLIDISDPRPVTIFQDVRFVQPVEASQLFVNKRISNVNVKNGVLQVLRTDGVEEQTVTGQKSFENVNLIEPILLSGKIESQSLERMNPVASIGKNLVLQGDYVIRGPVTVNRMLNVTKDIVPTNSQLGLRKLGESGLNLATSTQTNNRMIFKDVIQVRENLRAQTVNNIPVESFIKSEWGQEQVIKGRKIFKGNLLVTGSVNADVINEIDLRRLDETTLKRVSNSTQFIDGNVQVANLHVDQITAQNAKINEKDVNLMLSRKKPQQLTEIRAHNVKTQNFKSSKVNHNIGSKIFGRDLNFIIDDTITKDAFSDTVVAEKKFTNLKVENLQFADGNEWKEIITNFERILEGFNISSDVVLENQMEIGNLKVGGKINGIAFEDMLNNWLKLESNQVFTAPQHFNKITAQTNIILEAINGANMNQLLNEAIYIDKPVNLQNLQINGQLAVNTKLMTPMINGATFDGKLILNNTHTPQYLNKLRVKGDAFVQHLNFSLLNGINCSDFLNIFNGNNEPAPSLTINGEATFSQPSDVTFLNNLSVVQLYDTTWISGRDVELTGDDIQFLSEVEVEGLLYTNTLNNRDLKVLSENYFSKTKNQNLGGNLNVVGNVISTKNHFSASKVIVPKFVKLDDHIYFTPSDFAEKTLRHKVKQDITGNWRIKKLILHGDFDGIVNGLNIREDVLHARNLNDVVSGHKKFKSVEIHDILVKTINGIDVEDWLLHAVRRNSSTSQTIDGHVTFKDSVKIENNLQVYGTVNNIRVTPQTVLMKNRENQVINGDVTFYIFDPMNPNHNGVSNQIFIEELILRDKINDKYWREIQENVFRPDDTFINSKVIFEKELQVDALQTNRSIYGTNIVEFLKGSSDSSNILKFKQNMESLAAIGDDMKRSLSESVVELSHFEFVQMMTGSGIQKCVLFSKNLEYFLAIHEKKNRLEIISFHRWNREENKFSLDQSMTPLQYNAETFQIKHFYKVIYRGIDHLFLEFYDRNSQVFTQNLLVQDVSTVTFLPVITTTSKSSAKFFTWKDGLAPCYGEIHQFVDKIFVNCESMPQTVIQAENSIRKISSQNDLLILMTDDEKVQVYSNGKFFNVPNLINPQNFTSIEYNGNIYLAVLTDAIEGTIHHGDIHIFESPINDLIFTEIQKLTLHVPTDVRFSKAPSGDLLLYVLTRNEPRSFYVFSYAGSSNFVPSIGEDTIIKKASSLDVIQIDEKVEMATIVSGNNIHVIQAVLNIF